MNDIDMKLREKIKMLDEIDRMVKNEPPKSGNSSSNRIYNQSQNSTYNNKSVDKFSNTNISNDFDYPLQCNNTKKTQTTSGNNSQIGIMPKGKLREDPTKVNLHSNFNNYSHLNQHFEKPDRTKSNDNVNNYYTIYGNDIYSTKEYTEPFTGKSKKNLKLNERENTYGNGITTGRSLNSSKQLKTSQARSRTPTKRDKSPKQLVNININFNDCPKSPSQVGNRLYNYGFYVKDKIEKKRLEEDHNMMRQMTPEISNKAKRIQRDPKKFHERLYPAHKVVQPKFNDEFDQTNAINLNVNMNVETKNTIHTTPNFDDNNSYSAQQEDPTTRIYRKSPSTNNFSLPFDYKPKLDKNSLKIAANLTPSKIRLIAKKPKRVKNDLNDLSYLSEDNYSRSPSATPSRSRSKTPTNRTNELYSKGLEQYKKREIVFNQKKILDQEEFKNYTYRPKIISHSPVLTGRKLDKSPNKVGKSSETIEQDNSNAYEKQLHWKKNVSSRTEKMRHNHEQEMQGIYTFKPNISKNIKQNDEKFIMKNLNQIEDYVNRRRSALQKKKEDEEYKKKKFYTGEGYKGKMTVPKEFHLKTDERSRSRSKEGNRSRDSYLESRSNASPHNVHYMRDQLRANEFFENTVEPIYANYSTYQHESNQNYYPQQYQPQSKQSSNVQSNDNSMHVFMSAINNLHEQLVNFKI